MNIEGIFIIGFEEEGRIKIKRFSNGIWEEDTTISDTTLVSKFPVLLIYGNDVYLFYLTREGICYHISNDYGNSWSHKYIIYGKFNSFNAEVHEERVIVSGMKLISPFLSSINIFIVKNTEITEGKVFELKGLGIFPDIKVYNDSVFIVYSERRGYRYNIFFIKERLDNIMIKEITSYEVKRFKILPLFKKNILKIFMPSRGIYTLSIYDVSGRKHDIFRDRILEKRVYEISPVLTSGVYFVVLRKAKSTDFYKTKFLYLKYKGSNP